MQRETVEYSPDSVGGRSVKGQNRLVGFRQIADCPRARVNSREHRPLVVVVNEEADLICIASWCVKLDPTIRFVDLHNLQNKMFS